MLVEIVLTMMGLFLVTLDRTSTARLRLSDIYGTDVDGEWRFGEPEAYRGKLSAFDETSGFGDKNVLIPNYFQSASNDIVILTNHFVYFAHECEDILNETEAWIGVAVADPKGILIPLASLRN